MLYTNKKRECGECTECCQGWLFGTAHGKRFYPGSPCHFVSEKGCSIYDDRPQFPCKNFICSWLDDKSDMFPEWMRPDKCGVIMRWSETKKSKMPYLSVYECGKKIDSVVLNWLIRHSLDGAFNLEVQVDRGWNHYGTTEFVKEISGYVDRQSIASVVRGKVPWGNE